MTVPLDIEKYRRHVERFEMSEDQKTELLRAVWHIMESFIDRAFGIDSVQLSGAPCIAKRAEGEVPVLESDTIVTTPNRLQGAFRTSAGSCQGRKRKGDA